MGRAQSRKFKWKTHCDSFGPPEEIDEMAHIFSRHSISSVLLPFPRGKPASHALFEDNYHNPAIHTSDTIYVYFETQASIPRTLEHARVIWEIIYTSIGKFYAKAIWRNLNPDYRYDDELLSEQTFLMARLHDFGFGLAMLMAAGTNTSALRRLAFVDTYHLLAKVLVPCCLDRTEMSYDGYATQFKDILAKARNLMSRSPLPNGTSFTNEVGWLPLITFVALKCRIHAVRLGALELLRESRWREGPWDGTSLAHAVSNLIQLEGQHDWNDSPSDLLPSSGMRYVWTNMFWDFENRRMTMEYTKAWADEPGELEKVTRTVSG
ncbi:hypothetical protein TruAng_001078 [Truncatella angustata]|nr:hypothetical protein TruAng_001078 [Truncatella angustata]